MSEPKLRKFAATITKAVQTGTNAYRDVSVTKIFDQNNRLQDIIHWAGSHSCDFQEVLISEVE